MQELDKEWIGRRIRQIRLEAGLRQWELARLLGTTQSAIHKYEHGVIPEPKRLIELARVGSTTIEWVLTGKHSENGSTEQRRLSAELLATAGVIREIGDLSSVEEAVRILRDAGRALRGAEPPEGATQPAAHSDLRNQSRDTLRLLETARRIHAAVVHRLVRSAHDQLASSPVLESRAAATENEPDERSTGPS